MPVLAINKRANFDYEISDKFEAGIVLLGHEVKSAKAKHVNLKGAYISIRKGKKEIPELFLINSTISKYKKASNLDNHDPIRPRKLLLSKREINRLIGKKKEQGLTLVPTKMYTTRNLVKVEFGIGKGKKKYDKRADLKKKDVDKKVRNMMKRAIS